RLAGYGIAYFTRAARNGDGLLFVSRGFVGCLDTGLSAHDGSERVSGVGADARINELRLTGLQGTLGADHIYLRARLREVGEHANVVVQDLDVSAVHR